MGMLNLIKDRFHHWWKREQQLAFESEEQDKTALIRHIAQMAYVAGWRAAKRDRR